MKRKALILPVIAAGAALLAAPSAQAIARATRLRGATGSRLPVANAGIH